MIVKVISKQIEYQIQIYRTIYTVTIYILNQDTKSEPSIKVSCLDLDGEYTLVEGTERADVISTLISKEGKLF